LKHIIYITVFLLLCTTTAINVGAQDSIPRTAEKLRNYTLTPIKASMFASALPGLGQIYNRKYWKVPIVYAGFGALGYFIVTNTSNYNTWMTAYRDFTDDIPGTASYTKLEFLKSYERGEYDPILNDESYLASKASWAKSNMLNGVKYYRKYRDLSYIGVAAWYLFTILDANVDASLFDYNISDDLSATVAPLTVTSTGLSPGISFKLVKNF